MVPKSKSVRVGPIQVGMVAVATLISSYGEFSSVMS